MQITSSSDAGDGIRIVVSGDVDLETSARLRQAGEQALAEPACRRLVIDLSGVSFLDSTGVGALVTLRNAALDKDAKLVLLGPAPPVLRTLELTAMDSVFDIQLA